MVLAVTQFNRFLAEQNNLICALAALRRPYCGEFIANTSHQVYFLSGRKRKRYPSQFRDGEWDIYMH